MTAPKILSIENPKAIPLAKRVIQNHGIIVFPTDTIYGIAADTFSAIGINKIYQVKQRPKDKALPVLIGDLIQLESLILPISEKANRITKTFWPGQLTLVLPKGPKIPPELSPYPTIGIRMPDLRFTLQLLQETGPLATTSANLSGGANPVTVQDVIEQLDGEIDLILDGGPTPGSTASTVIDVTGPEIKILRQGPIRLEDLETLWK
ncbi:MAG: L-threonylcarbamoyladenylate synthase [Chloroflexota bacterium]|nr:L-threonylcarbamoyladenylate synthase [Chloroflexota bacterium]